MTATSADPGAAPPSRHRRSGGPGRSGRGSRLLRGQPGDPAWARPALLGLLAATALLYLIGLGSNGWSNEFYAAAVQAGTKSWKAFLFGSMDSSNFITVDKPAGFLWPMELSARIFGLNSWSLLVPQALAGVATVGVLYATVRRWFGPVAALIAGAVTALTPVATLMFRFDNPDAALVLVLTLAAYAITRAIESGQTRWVVAAGAFLGLGFLCKQLAAFTVLPGFALAYLWAGQPTLGKRIWQLLAGGAALVVAAGWWIAVVELTPASDRPYVGGSTDNSILNLTFNYNGFGRLTGSEGGFGGGGTAPGGTAGGEISRELERLLPEGGRGGGGFGGGGFGGATGITRLFTDQFAGQVGWLIPAVLVALAALLWLSLRAARTDRTRAGALVWGGWLLATGLVFSYMSGIIHPYYTIALAPAIGALAGIGAVALWRVRDTWLGSATLAAGIALTAIWAWFLLDRSPDWFPWLRLVILIAGGAAAALILLARAVPSPVRLSVSLPGRVLLRMSVSGRRRLVLTWVPLAVVAGLGGPLAYSLQTSATVHTGSIPSAGPASAGGFGGPGGGVPGGGELPAGLEEQLARGGAGGAGASGGPGGGGFGGQSAISAALSKLLQSGASGYTWAAATISSTSAASIELGSNGIPVMAIGGFSGSDPAPTLAEFEKLVAAHKIHYFVNGGGMGGFAGGGGSGSGAGEALPEGSTGGPGGFGGGSSQITSWVQAHFTSETVGGTTVYDLTKPTAG